MKKKRGSLVNKNLAQRKVVYFFYQPLTANAFIEPKALLLKSNNA